MNPFEAHSNNMAAYESMLAEPVAGATGNSIVYGAAEFPAVVGHFVVRQVLVNGGLSPRLIGQAIIQKAHVPKAVIFKTGQLLVVKQIGGSVRRCSIEEVEDTFLEFRLNLWDQNEKL